ncbi:SidA/IucD/PvdA family monooxygenase [Serratia rubidaea]|uniref:L-ornithine 5-monooxygenase n=1 Tax=Serratia rubidaea TaxID=61652 RepID=A0A3S4YUV4_SERRU|nr:SidA/IucD/PvdA family monooxygenase [Serratia rubidaea]MDC6118615.1 SidA/IucD/PvdA family monooxygenase [Serratia rubidaea]MDK1702699.1 SidA/IucD/PvdA family monooxygenase [Serratia rubidaea]MEB7587196.1 SidA/IucD/PvdA family monooxygenase [Serratia rubidaea]VEI68987.1 L-ornithine 5-monooxygenase [Serratia rubidaea]HDJ1440177.1 SidA/IucD/PvdA family monooxygenase [Serratia rubidaea]
MTQKIYDILGIGFGPANIALAAALEELAPQFSVHFLERRSAAAWQPGMLLSGSDIQNHPLRDLVTPRNPKSHYSFTNFLYENQRLYAHLNLPLHYPLRLEYAQYIQWVAAFFAEQVNYQSEAAAIEPVQHPDSGEIVHYRVTTQNGEAYLARSIVMAPGRTPFIPAPFDTLRDSRVVHLNQYLPALAQAAEGNDALRVAVVGGSQSAVELLLHASSQHGVSRVAGFTRNFAFRQKDTSPFSDEVYFPEFVDTFYHASAENKARLRRELVHTNYSTADIDVLDQLYVRQYENRLLQRDTLQILTCHEIESCQPAAGGVRIESRHFVDGSTFSGEFDLVVLATGFLDLGTDERQEPCPQLLKPLNALQEDGAPTLTIGKDYRLENIAGGRLAPVYLNGLCESTHGMGDAGSFSLLAIRAQAIVESLAQRLTPRGEGGQ